MALASKEFHFAQTESAASQTAPGLLEGDLAFALAGIGLAGWSASAVGAETGWYGGQIPPRPGRGSIAGLILATNEVAELRGPQFIDTA
jgi:hypothetical protein